MAIVLHHHPFTRAAAVVWMLEEAGCDYSLEYVDFRAGDQKQAKFRELNPMGKLPTLVDGETVVTESAAIGLYLADRYALGRLCPKPEDPARGAYYRWSLYAPSVIEPGCMAKAASWEYRPGSAGWGKYEEILDTISAAVREGPWLLGEQFTMADVIFGGTLRFMLMFDMLDKRPEYTAYVERLSARPAAIKAKEINDGIIKDRGLEAG